MNHYNQLNTNPCDKPNIRINVPEALVPGQLAEIQVIMETNQPIYDVRSLELSIINEEIYKPVRAVLEGMTMITACCCDTAITTALIAGSVIAVIGAASGDSKDNNINCDKFDCLACMQTLELCLRCCELCCMCHDLATRNSAWGNNETYVEYVYVPPPSIYPDLAPPTYIQPPMISQQGQTGQTQQQQQQQDDPNIVTSEKQGVVPQQQQPPAYQCDLPAASAPSADPCDPLSMVDSTPATVVVDPVEIYRNNGEDLPCCYCCTKVATKNVSSRAARKLLMQTLWGDWIDHNGTIQAGKYEKTFAFHVPGYATADFLIKEAIWKAYASTDAKLRIIRGDLNEDFESSQEVKVLPLVEETRDTMVMPLTSLSSQNKDYPTVTAKLLPFSQLTAARAGDPIRFNITIDNTENPDTDFRLVSAKVKEDSNAFKRSTKCFADGGKSVKSINIPAGQVVSFDLGAVIPKKWKGDVDGSVFQVYHFLSLELKGKRFLDKSHKYELKVPFIGDETGFVTKVPSLSRENPYIKSKRWLHSRKPSEIN